MSRPTIERLRELFDCDAETGTLRWKISARGIVKGADAGSAKNKGRYRYVKVDDRSFTVATIIWAMHHGEWPSSRLASKSGNPDDCRIANLVPQRGLCGFDHSTSEGRSAYLRAHRRAHPDYYRDMDLRRNFGISLLEFKDKLNAQFGVCAICDRPETMERNGKELWLAVDHDHFTGGNRELLCSQCNQALGKFEDRPALLRRAAEYLERHGKTEMSWGIPAVVEITHLPIGQKILMENRANG